jgi:hypothetical protein
LAPFANWQSKILAPRSVFKKLTHTRWGFGDLGMAQSFYKARNFTPLFSRKPQNPSSDFAKALFSQTSPIPN